MKHKYPILRKSFSLAMALLLALSMPMQVFAEVLADLSNGDVNIGAENVGHYVAPDTPVVEAHGGSVTVVQSGGETNHTVTVDTTSNPVASSSGGTGNATLNANDNFYTEAAGGDNHVDVVLGQNDGSTDNGVDIDAGNTPAIDVKTDSGDTVDIQIGSATTNELHSDEPAISITGGGDVTISGDSSGSLYSEGITVEDGSSLTIKSGLVDVNGNVAVENNADLTVKDDSLDVSGRIGAGGGDITINGGDVTADGGIGGLSGETNGEIVITGGNVVATSKNDNAAIGAGADADSSAITITGGTVTATNTGTGAGIGGGENGDGNDITISGGTVEAESAYGAGIGGGKSGDANNITIGNETPGSEAAADVTATSKYGGAGIGGGYCGEANDITIVNAKRVVAKGGTNTDGTGGAGIGGGAYAKGSVCIEGGVVNATGAYGAAGIGGGYMGCGNVTITEPASVGQANGSDWNWHTEYHGQDCMCEEPENPEDPNPEDPNPEDPKPEDPKPEDPKPENSKTESPTASQTTEPSHQGHVHVKTFYRKGYVWCYCGYQMNEVLKVKNDGGKEIDWTETVERGIVTITLSRDNADFETWQEGLADLDLVGIHTVVFQTSDAETEIDVADLMTKCTESDQLVLSHRGSETKLLKTQEISLA